MWIIDGGWTQQSAIGGFSSASSSMDVRSFGRSYTQTLSSLSTANPVTPPISHLFGRGLGQLTSTSNFGTVCIWAAGPSARKNAKRRPSAPAQIHLYVAIAISSSVTRTPRPRRLWRSVFRAKRNVNKWPEAPGRTSGNLPADLLTESRPSKRRSECWSAQVYTAFPPRQLKLERKLGISCCCCWSLRCAGQACRRPQLGQVGCNRRSRDRCWASSQQNPLRRLCLDRGRVPRFRWRERGFCQA